MVKKRRCIKGKKERNPSLSTDLANYSV